MVPAATIGAGQPAPYWKCVVAALVAINIFGTPRYLGDWLGQASAVKAGALYFLGLAAVELSGFFLQYLPRHLAPDFIAFLDRQRAK